MIYTAPSASGFASRAVLRIAALLCLFSATILAQAPATSSGDYTDALPSVQRVMSQMQGTDPTDTLARQVAVLEYLQVYIQRIKETRDYRGPYSPGEARLRTEYAQAQYDLMQAFKKSHTPEQLTAFDHLEGNYSLNNALDWIKQLEGQQAADTYKGTEAELSASQQRYNDRIQKDLAPTPSDGGLSGLFGGGGGGPLDASQKRCLELGGSYNACAGAIVGAINALGTILTGGTSTSGSNEPPPLNGVTLVGMYHSRTDLPELSLSDGSALLSKCGTLVDDSHSYAIRKSGGAVQLVVDNEPDPITLNLRADGSLAGPGSIQVKGRIITAYHNEYVCSNGNCTTSSTPVYGPKLDRCTLSLLAPQAAPPPPEKPTGLAGAFSDMIGDNSVATIYGFRVTGDYASSAGMKLSFNNTFVTLDCGQAHINAHYVVDNTASGFVIRVQNSGGAFQLGLAPDNTLRGSGSTTVAGRLVSAVNGENVSFTPHSESCSIGTFSPKGKKSTMLASSGPIPTVPASYAPSPTPAPVSPASAAAPSSIESALANAGISAPALSAQVQLRVLLSSAYSGTNPLAGQTVFVERKPIDQILRELGIAVPANATPAQAMQALQTQCHSPQGCSSAVKGLSSYYVTTTKLDASGKATLSATAATGAYYFFAIVPNAGGSIVWDVAANLAAGDNTVTFTPANGQPVQ